MIALPGRTMPGRNFIRAALASMALLSLLACLTDSDPDKKDPDPVDTVKVVVKPDSTNGWLYGYDSLLRDLARWRQSPMSGSIPSGPAWKAGGCGW